MICSYQRGLAIIYSCRRPCLGPAALVGRRAGTERTLTGRRTATPQQHAGDASVDDTPEARPMNLLEVSTRADHARHIITGFALAAPGLAGPLRQVSDALSEIPALAAEITGLRARLTACRTDRAKLAAAGRMSVTAYRKGEPDPLACLRDELHAQGFGADREGW